MKDDNLMVGIILAAKAITQSIFNCFIGTITQGSNELVFLLCK